MGLRYSLQTDQGRIRERDRRYLLDRKGFLQRKLEKLKVLKREIEEVLKKERKHEPLNKEIDELKMEKLRLEKSKTILATENRNSMSEKQDQQGQYEGIQRTQKTITDRDIELLHRRNKEIWELKREIIYLQNRLGSYHDS